MLIENLKIKNTKKKQQKARANKIGIPVSLLNEIENSRRKKQEININKFAGLCFSLVDKEVDSVFSDQLLEQLSFVSNYGTCIWDEDGIKARVDLGDNEEYNFFFTVTKNKLSTNISFFNTTIENTFLKEKDCSYAMQIVTKEEKCEKMLEGLINKNYDAYRVKIEKNLHCFDEKNKEFAIYLETRIEDYALNKNTNEKIINNQEKNFNYRNKQYFFRVGNQLIYKKENEKQEETYYSSNHVFIKDDHIVLPKLLRVKEISAFDYNKHIGQLKKNDNYKKLIKVMSK